MTFFARNLDDDKSCFYRDVLKESEPGHCAYSVIVSGAKTERAAFST